MPAPEEPLILKTRDPNFPQLLFEWHRQAGKVYVLGLPGKWVDRVFVPAVTGTARAFCLAEHCDTHGRFLGFVQTYLRGYRQGLADEQLLAKGEAQIVLGYEGGGPPAEKVTGVKGTYDG